MEINPSELDMNSSGVKRKSLDNNDRSISAKEFPLINDENVINSSNPKRLRFREALTSNMPIPVQSAKNIVKSSLPRFVTNSQTNKSSSSNANSVTSKANSSSNNQLVKTNSTPGEKKRANTTEINTAERERTTLKVISYNESASPLTPGTAIGFSSISNGLLRRLKKTVTRSASAEVIRNYFDCAFTVTEEKVNNILANLKVKSKWDYKEKSKKQESVIKELKENISTLLVEAKDLRDHCLTHENQMNSLLRDSYDEFQESAQVISTLKTNETKLKKDLVRFQEELELTSTNMMKIKTDHSPLRHKVKDYETKYNEMQQQLATEESSRIIAQQELQQVRKELEELQISTDKEIRSVKEQFESRLEQLVHSHREELSSLREEVSRKQGELNRFVDEKSDLDRRKGELQEGMVVTQSRLREAENSIARYEKEVSRQSSDLDHMREQLTLKDSDMRATLNSLTEIQRQATEEKTSLRCEINSLQTRIHSLEEERLSNTAQFAAKKEESASLLRDLCVLRDNVSTLESKLIAKESELQQGKESLMQLEVEKELRARCEIREEAERRERIAANAQWMAIQSECAVRIHDLEEKKKQEVDCLRMELNEERLRREESVSECRRQMDLVMGLENEVKQLSHALENASSNHEAVEKLGRVTGELEIMKRRLKEVSESQELQVSLDNKKIVEYEEKLRIGEMQRRKLHNLVQELRGNVRVYARVRPFLPSDGIDLSSQPQDPTVTARQDSNSLRIYRNPKNPSDDRVEDHVFTFDRVFGPSVSQESLFEEVSEFVQSALDGYHVCLFSYGQTGSGKTHTMQGSGSGSMRGIIPRAMQQVGLYKNELEAKGWDYEMEVSFVEIYNEDIRDLLRTSSHHEIGRHEIKKDLQGHVSISDITMVSVDPNDSQQVDGIMELAARHRSVGQTNMNERSSRSHSVFALHLKATNKDQGIVLKGTLSLVDLAGSERLDRSGATGTQMKETVAINKSLSALTDVFVAIANKQSHIPFRNSKLTYLLQPALSGDGKTLMMVNLSPTQESFQESLCSLRLAKQVNQCELGKPKRQLKEVIPSNPSSSSSLTQTQPSSSTKRQTPLATSTSTTTGGGSKKMLKK